MNKKAIARRPAKVICLGEILFDCLADQLGKSVSEVTSWTAYPGGAPANVACALTKLGTPAAFIGCVGQDAPGQKLVSLLESIGVDLSGVQYHQQYPSRQVYVTRTEQGDRTFAGFGDHLVDNFADAYLQPQLLPAKLFLAAEYLVLGTLGLAYPQTRAAVFKALELAVEYHLKIVLDINWRPLFWRETPRRRQAQGNARAWREQQQALPLIEDLYPYVDFLKLAAEEAQWLFDTTDAGAISYRLGSVEGVLVTNGEAPVSYCLSDNEGIVHPLRVAAKDTIGAGDAFIAGFVHQLCQQGLNQLSNPQTAQEIVKYACAVGSLTTTQLGAITAQPSPSEVLALLNQYGNSYCLETSESD